MQSAAMKGETCSVLFGAEKLNVDLGEGLSLILGLADEAEMPCSE